MEAQRMKQVWLLLVVGFVAGSSTLGATASAASSLDGVWSGSGEVNPKDGDRETVRCRVQYKQESEKVFGVTATCATRSRKIQQTGKVLKATASTYVGDFYNQSYDVSGRVRVVLNGATQTVTFRSARGTGSVSLRKQ